MVRTSSPANPIAELFDQATAVIHPDGLGFGRQSCFDILELQAFADLQGLPKERAPAIRRNQADERDLASSKRQPAWGRCKVGWQLTEPLAPPVLRRRPVSELGMDMMLVDRYHQLLQFLAYLSRAVEAVAQQQRLEPTIEMLDRAVALRFACRDEDWFDAQVQAQPNDPTQRAGPPAPAAKLLAVVELDRFWQPQLLPGMHQEGEHSSISRLSRNSR